MQRGSALPFIILGLLILFLGLFGFLILYRQNTETANPNKLFPKPIVETKSVDTFTSNTLSFSFDYPKQFTAQKDSEEEFNTRGNGDFRKNFKYYITYEPGQVMGAVVVLDESKSFEESPFTVWVFANEDNLTVDSWYAKFWYYPFVWGDYTSRRDNVAPVKEATISGQLAKYGVVTYRGGEPKFMYLPYLQKMYLFRVIGETGEKILATFKFLE